MEVSDWIVRGGQIKLGLVLPYLHPLPGENTTKKVADPSMLQTLELALNCGQ